MNSLLHALSLAINLLFNEQEIRFSPRSDLSGREGNFSPRFHFFFQRYRSEKYSVKVASVRQSVTLPSRFSSRSENARRFSPSTRKMSEKIQFCRMRHCVAKFSNPSRHVATFTHAFSGPITVLDVINCGWIAPRLAENTRSLNFRGTPRPRERKRYLGVRSRFLPSSTCISFMTWTLCRRRRVSAPTNFFSASPPYLHSIPPAPNSFVIRSTPTLYFQLFYYIIARE